MFIKTPTPKSTTTHQKIGVIHPKAEPELELGVVLDLDVALERCGSGALTNPVPLQARQKITGPLIGITPVPPQSLQLTRAIAKVPNVANYYHRELQVLEFFVCCSIRRLHQRNMRQYVPIIVAMVASALE